MSRRRSRSLGAQEQCPTVGSCAVGFLMFRVSRQPGALAARPSVTRSLHVRCHLARDPARSHDALGSADEQQMSGPATADRGRAGDAVGSRGSRDSRSGRPADLVLQRSYLRSVRTGAVSLQFMVSRRSAVGLGLGGMLALATGGAAELVFGSRHGNPPFSPPPTRPSDQWLILFTLASSKSEMDGLISAGTSPGRSLARLPRAPRLWQRPSLRLFHA